MNGSGRRSLIRVEPTRLVELAASSERILTSMVQDWELALDDLSQACQRLGDATGTVNVTSSYADSLTDAGEVVSGLAEALRLGIAGLVDAVADALRADDAVAAQLTRTTRAVSDDGFGPLPGPGDR